MALGPLGLLIFSFRAFFRFTRCLIFNYICLLIQKIKKMKTLKLNHDQFLTQIANHLNYKPDSANYALYEAFLDILTTDGGDDIFAHLNPNEVAFEFSKHVTLKHIEDYDNEIDTFEPYLEIKPTIIKKLTIS